MKKQYKTHIDDRTRASNERPSHLPLAGVHPRKNAVTLPGGGKERETKVTTICDLGATQMKRLTQQIRIGNVVVDLEDVLFFPDRPGMGSRLAARRRVRRLFFAGPEISSGSFSSGSLEVTSGAGLFLSSLNSLTNMRGLLSSR